MDREHILGEIRRTTEANGGTPLGRARFATETGIHEHDWRGRYWARWSDALAEAGFQPNELQQRYDEDELPRETCRRNQTPSQDADRV